MQRTPALRDKLPVAGLGQFLAQDFVGEGPVVHDGEPKHLATDDEVLQPHRNLRRQQRRAWVQVVQAHQQRQGGPLPKGEEDDALDAKELHHRLVHLQLVVEGASEEHEIIHRHTDERRRERHEMLRGEAGAVRDRLGRVWAVVDAGGGPFAACAGDRDVAGAGGGRGGVVAPYAGGTGGGLLLWRWRCGARGLWKGESTRCRSKESGRNWIPRQDAGPQYATPKGLTAIPHTLSRTPPD